MVIRSISILASAALMVATASAASQGETRKEPNRAARQGANQAQRQMQQMQRQRQMQPQTRPSAPAESNLQPNIPRSVPNATPMPGPHAGGWLREHQYDSPQQMEQALRSDPGFQRLPAQRQEALLKQLQNFSSRPPAQREQMLNRMETLESFSPGQRQQVRQVWEEFRQLPTDRRQKVHQIYQRLLCMNPSERQTVMASERFRNNFSDQERGIINGALNFGVPVNGGAQPNCAAGPQSFNMLTDEELFRSDLAEYWAALQPAPSAVPAVYASGTVETAAVHNAGNGFVSNGTATTGGSTATNGGSTAGSGNGNGNGHFGTGSQRLGGPGGNGGSNDPNLSTDQLIQQVVADALQRLQVECSAGGAENGGLTLGSGHSGEPRLSGVGSTFEADLQRLLTRTQSEPDGQALAQQIVQVLVTAIQARQDERSDATCVGQATQLFTAEIERILGVRHSIAAGSATEAALN